ncbi:MAG: thrombospondin type 3 repeat-containing protein [Myxococcota bacterium]
MAALVAGSVSPVAAEQQVLNTQRWQSTVDGRGLARTHAGQLLGHLDFSLFLWTDYERNPLVLTDRRSAARGPWGTLPGPYRKRVASLVESRLATEMGLSVGLFNWVQLFGALPVSLYQDRGLGISSATTAVTPLNQFNLGDLRLGAKIRLLHHEQFLVDLAFLPQVTLPLGLGFRALSVRTGGRATEVVPDVGTSPWAHGYYSEGFPTLQPELALSRELWGFFAGANVGLRVRRPYEVQKLTISQELVWRAGVGFKGARLAERVALMRFFPVEVALEASGASALNHPYLAVPYLTPGATTVEAKLPAPLQPYQHTGELSAVVGLDVLGFQPYVGAAAGVLPGWGTPDYRVMAGVRVGTDARRSFPPRMKDRDGDGVADGEDLCPGASGLASLGGCPVPDDDGDGVASDVDVCPLEPGKGGADGCPAVAAAVTLPDGDGDGVPDEEDLCPTLSDDVDGFQDTDGCPEGDNDGDGITDVRDLCPLQAESFNGHQDGDGCPDLETVVAGDADGDGVADARDLCPYDAEDADQHRDGDGCPDGDDVGRADDADGDGVPGAADACVALAEDRDGFLDDDGCPEPDNDEDGFPDGNDACPLEAETWDDAGDGCPARMGGVAPTTLAARRAPSADDADGDGVRDGEDACPHGAEDADGFQDEDGCAERDNDADGIPDVADRCALEAETPNAFRDDDGCPDTAADGDADGWADIQDRCPTEAGAAPDGCPHLARSFEDMVKAGDSDGDGLVDGADPCPGSAEDRDGFEDEDGCPERDNDEDGLDDARDSCPLEAETINGRKDTDGCADKGAPTTRAGGRIPERIGFGVGTADISPEGRALLSQVVLRLRANRHLQVEIQGHADGAGSDEVNSALSHHRAESVKAFLVQEGIEAERLQSRGYGATRPRASNDTEAGRQANRRVEFVVIGDSR